MCKHNWIPRLDGLGYRCRECGSTVDLKQIQALPPHERHEFWCGRLSLDGRLQPTKNTWVFKDKDGALTRVNVADMKSSHVARWVRYFRDKFADDWMDWRNNPSDRELIDSIIRARMVTGSAILAELRRRDMEHVPAMVPMPTLATSGTLPGPVTAQEQRKAATIPLPLSNRQRRQTRPSDEPPVPHGFRHIDLGDDDDE